MCGIESENTTVCVNHTGNAYNNNDIMYMKRQNNEIRYVQRKYFLGSKNNCVET